jgi:3-dehydrosphinganine reductase
MRESAPAGLFVEQDVSKFELQMRVNYLGNVHCVKAALPGMLQRGRGRIVLVTSSLAVLGFAGATTATYNHAWHKDILRFTWRHCI